MVQLQARTGIAMICAAALLIAALGAPSGSSADPAGCPGTYCVWTKENFNGKRLVVETKKLTNLPRWLNNRASSAKWKIGASEEMLFFFGRNGNGSMACSSGPGSTSGFPPSVDNRISSTDVRRSSLC